MSGFKNVIVVFVLALAFSGNASAKLLHCKNKEGQIENKYRLEGQKLFYVFTQVEREAKIFYWLEEAVVFDDRNVYFDTLTTYLGDIPISNESLRCACKSENLKNDTARQIDRVNLKSSIVALRSSDGIPVYDYFFPFREHGIDKAVGPKEIEFGNQLCVKWFGEVCRINKMDRVTGFFYNYQSQCEFVSKQF